MNKRITSLLLSFVMVFVMLVTAVPAFAVTGKSSYYKMTPDKTTASPGDTITYSVKLGPIDSVCCMRFEIIIPDGLTYVEGSGKAVEGLAGKLKAPIAEFTESTKMFVAGSGNYTSTDETELMTFQCKVNADASGEQVVKLYVEDPDDLFDQDEDNIAVDEYTLSTITVKAAPKPATALTLNKTEMSLTTGQDDTSLVATVTPADSTDTVVWSTNAPEVAKVDAATGKVTAVAPGEAVITAKAGEQSASCTVRVTCAHALTTVDAKASNCTEKGWDAYQKCSLCENLFDMSGNPISAIPYRATNDNHDFNTSDWGYKEADGHAHICNRDADHHDTVIAHTPGAAATETTAQTCTECGYIIQPATGHIHAKHLTKVDAVNVTCTTDGNKEYYKCDCGKFFEDDAANVEIEDHSSVVLKATGHSYIVKKTDEAHRKSTAADCREYDTYWYTCANDAAHSAKDDAEATDKFYNGTRGAHVFGTDWVNRGTAGHAHKCKFDDTYDTVKAHRPGSAATETEDQVCLDCGAVLAERTGHIHANHLTPVKGKAATCTADGNKAYYKCSCGAFFEDAAAKTEIKDKNSVVLKATGHSYTVKKTDEAHRKSTAADCREYDTYWYTCANDEAHSAKDDAAATDKFYNGAQGAHVYGTDWVDLGESGHAHKCLYDDTYDAAQPHTPDHEGGATFDYAVKCTECQHVIEEQLEEGTIRVEVPFKLIVKKTGEMDPAKESFQFMIEPFGTSVKTTIVKDTITTDGEKTYEGSFVFTCKERDVRQIAEGFILSQIKGTAEGWKYDEAKFYVMPMFADDYNHIDEWTFFQVTDKENLDTNNPLEEIIFTNSYNMKKQSEVVTPPETTKPTETPTPSEPPKPTETIKPVIPTTTTETPAPADTKKPAASNEKKAPKTDDNGMMAFWFTLLLAGSAVAGTTIISKKRKTNVR
ncbi:Ig-like domain-containing protein [Eubacterium ramulus]